MKEKAAADEVAKAWGEHRRGQHRSAIAQFERILGGNPKNIDAHYGLGLASKAIAEQDEAISAFQRALELAQRAYESLQATEPSPSQPEDEIGARNLANRYYMLMRMLEQRLVELGATPA